MSSEFDPYAQDYEAALNRGISISGEDSSFFARRRIQWLAQSLRQRDLVVNRVLDFGCGTGNATPYFFEFLNVDSVVGVDLSDESLEVARRRHGHLSVEFRRTADHVGDASFDLVFCNGVFHHIALDRRESELEYIASCLRPGGLFVMWENNPWSPAARMVMSRIPFDRDAVMVWPTQARRLALHAGLQPRSTDFLFVFPRSLAFLRWLEPMVSRLPLGAQYQMLSEKIADETDGR